MANKDFDNIKIPENIDDAIDRGIKKAKKNKPKKDKNFKKLGVIAAVGLGVIGITGGYDSAFAGVTNVVNKIEDILGLDKNIDTYKTILNQTREKDGFTVTLNEVVLDGNHLIVASTVTSPKEEGKPHHLGDTKLYINGKRVINNSSGSSEEMGENVIRSVMDYKIDSDINIEEDLEIKIVYESLYKYEEEIEEKRGNWKFEFKTNGKELKEDTVVIPLDEKMQGENMTIELTGYRKNKLGDRILADIKGMNYGDIKLAGKDNLGNKIEFYLSEVTEEGVAEFKRQERPDKKKIEGEVSELKLSVYAVSISEEVMESGEGLEALYEDHKKIGEEITIKIKE